MRRVRGCEILAVALTLALLLTAELVFDGAAAPSDPSAPAGDARPAHAEFDGVLIQEHALARAGTGTHPAVGKFVAVGPAVDDAGCCPLCTADSPVVAGMFAFSVPGVPSVRAPPAVAVA